MQTSGRGSSHFVHRPACRSYNRLFLNFSPRLPMSASSLDSFGVRQPLSVDGKTYEIFSLQAFAEKHGSIAHLPFSLRVMLENLLRNENGRSVTADQIRKA